MKLSRLSSDGGGSVSLEVGSESSFTGSWDGLNDGELNLGVSVYSSSGSSDIIALSDNRGSDDLDGFMSSLMLTTHFHIKLRYGSIQADISEFLVHVVDGSSRLISEDDAVGLNGSLTLFEDLTDAEDFTLGSLELVESSGLEPELGFSNNWVGSEDSDGDNFTFSLLLSGGSSASHQVLVDVHL